MESATPKYIFRFEIDTKSPKLYDGTDHISATFQLAGANVMTAHANTLRRQIYTSIATVGFRVEDIKISVNTTPLPNEMLSHRISLIPVAAQIDETQNFTFVLDVENRGPTTLNITSADIEVRTAIGEPRADLRAKFFPPDPITGQNILITRLRASQFKDKFEQLKLVATASSGTVAEHARWAATSQCSYSNTLDTGDTARVEAYFKQWLANSKRIDYDTAGDVEALRREFNSMEIQRVFRTNEMGEPNDFVFTLESRGFLHPHDILERGLQQCVLLFAKYKLIATVEIPSVRFRRSETLMNAIDVVFAGESHTLGNMLQTHINRYYVSTEYGVDDFDTENNVYNKVNFVAYSQPHPTKSEIVLRLGINMDPPNYGILHATARSLIARSCEELEQFYMRCLDDIGGKRIESAVATAETPILTQPAVVSASNTLQTDVAPPNTLQTGVNTLPTIDLNN